jgi:predicted kinase
MSLPTLVVVSGPAGSGKTTLARELARSIACPAICRDEIKEGMVHTAGTFEPTANDELTGRTLPLFFGVIRLLLQAGVTLVADAAFQHHVWSPNLDPLLEMAQLRVIQCHTDPATAHTRRRDRGPRPAHDDVPLLVEDTSAAYFDGFRRLTIDAPSIDVDTTGGYQPTLEQIVAFVVDG